MRSSELLKAWEAIHGMLPERWRQEFLERDEIREILRYPPYAVRNAIGHSPRLAEILRELKAKWIVEERLANVRNVGRASSRLSNNREKTDAQRNRDLAQEGKILPLPDNPAASKEKRSAGYRTGIEAELRSIAQRKKWF